MALETSPDAPAPLRQISQLIADYIGRLGAVWVEGEIAQLNRRRGICFLTLRDLQATISISVTCHVSVLDASAVPVTEGARVVVHARPDFYAPTGRFALNASEIRPVGTGELLARLERLKQALAAEGLFEPRLKRPLPFLPQCIGLITGRDSAAERDVLQNARLRWPGVRFQVRHSLVQGESAAAQVMTHLAELDAHPEVDVIIIARGGGSMEDLLPFSDEGLVRAVHAATTPIVSAIGHEPDTPIVDLAADVRASTPTDAAKRVVPDVGEQRILVEELLGRVRAAFTRYLDREREGLAAFRSRPVLADPGARLDTEQSAVDQHRQRLTLTTRHRLDRGADDLTGLLSRLRSLSPQSTLDRGYAVALGADGRVLRSISEVTDGDAFDVRLADGRVHATAHGSTGEES